MTMQDIPQAQEIEKEAFPNEWPPPSYKRELQNKLAHYLVAVTVSEPPPRKVEPENIIAKFLKRLPFSEERANKPLPFENSYVLAMAGIWYMFDEAHITTLAVREKYRGKGLGEIMLMALIDLAMELDSRVVTLEVRASNKSAQQLYSKYGFKNAGLRKGYYSEDGEDALIMTTDCITSASYQEQLQSLSQAHETKWGLDYKGSRKF